MPGKYWPNRKGTAELLKKRFMVLMHACKPVNNALVKIINLVHNLGTVPLEKQEKLCRLMMQSKAELL